MVLPLVLPMGAPAVGFRCGLYTVLHFCLLNSGPHNLGDRCCRRGIAAAMGANRAVDDHHADAREIAELDAVE